MSANVQKQPSRPAARWEVRFSSGHVLEVEAPNRDRARLRALLYVQMQPRAQQAAYGRMLTKTRRLRSADARPDEA